MDIISVFIAFLLVCFITWIFYSLFLSENIFKDAGIPYSSKFASLIGMIFIFIYPLHDLVLFGYKRHKKLFGHFNFGRPQLTVGDPDLIRQILVKDFQFFVDRMDSVTGDPYFDNNVSILRGEDWRRVRTLLSPGFSTGKIKRMATMILDCSETLKKNLGTIASAEEPIDVKRFFGAFTMDAIVCTAFGSRIDSHNDPGNPFVVAARDVFGKSNQFLMVLFLSFNHITRALGLKASHLFGSQFFLKATKNLIANREHSKKKIQSDLLQVLLDARDLNRRQVTNDSRREHEIDVDILDDEDKFNADGYSQSTGVSDGKMGLSEVEFMATCIGFFIGGYETVASTLTFAIYELALNEECQKTLIEEIDELMMREKELTYENVQTLKYLDAVVSETLRKYPPAGSLPRMATSDYTLSDANITIPKGTMVTIPVYGLHHDPEYYPDPEKFLPSRFLPEEKSSRNPYVYLPFGAGQRNCIAMRFALIEIKLCLANVLRSFTFLKTEKTQVPLKFSTLKIQLVAPKILLRVEKRNQTI